TDRQDPPNPTAGSLNEPSAPHDDRNLQNEPRSAAVDLRNSQDGSTTAGVDHRNPQNEPTTPDDSREIPAHLKGPRARALPESVAPTAGVRVTRGPGSRSPKSAKRTHHPGRRSRDSL